jgi:hypothetical protein
MLCEVVNVKIIREAKKKGEMNHDCLLEGAF